MKDLVLQKRENLGFTPEVAGYLASIKESEYSYKYLNVRHPAGVFEVASSHVVKDFIELLKELEEHQTNYENDRPIGLEKKFRELINDFFKFYDSCYEIMVGCCKNHTPPTEEFYSKWLDKNGYSIGKDFHNGTWNDQENLRKIYNKLKHTSSLLRSVNFNRGKSAIMGFFVQGAEDGIPGPDRDIHPKYHGSYTGSSYNFTLRELYYILYKICFVLNKILSKHFRDVYNLELNFNEGYKTANKDWEELYERMNKLPNAYFPNESGKRIFQFRISNNKLIFAKRPAESVDLNGFMTHMLTSGDGFTRTFRIPYLAGSRPPS
jgi:hypothetical protein